VAVLSAGPERELSILRGIFLGESRYSINEHPHGLAGVGAPIGSSGGLASGS
jgi:hypothetical protein